MALKIMQEGAVAKRLFSAPVSVGIIASQDRKCCLHSAEKTSDVPSKDSASLLGFVVLRLPYNRIKIPFLLNRY